MCVVLKDVRLAIEVDHIFYGQYINENTKIYDINARCEQPSTEYLLVSKLQYHAKRNEINEKMTFLRECLVDIDT